MNPFRRAPTALAVALAALLAAPLAIGLAGPLTVGLAAPLTAPLTAPLVAPLTAYLVAPLAAQEGIGLCEQMLAERGAGTRSSTALHGQAGLGWNFGPESRFDEVGGGPVSQLSLYADLLFAAERCDEEGGIELGLVPHGARASVALSNALWSDYAGLSAGLAYLRTGSAVKWWVGPELSGLGVDTDNVGLGVGGTVGIGLYNWVAATAAPTWLVRGRGLYSDGFLLTVQLSISRQFRDEHFGS